LIVEEAVNKPNHPIQNPLLLVTEPRTHDNINPKGCELMITVGLIGNILFDEDVSTAAVI
jgi:hypothetical protein